MSRIIAIHSFRGRTGKSNTTGVRVFVCLDPFGYEWEFSQPVPGMEPANGTEAAQATWSTDGRS